MTREQIEKSAGEYSGSVLGFKDNPVVMNKHKAFMDGAQWRINSVWHNADEEPEQLDKTILVELDEIGIEGYIYDTLEAGDYKYILQRKKLYSKATRWAYIEDLLPDRKEDER